MELAFLGFADLQRRLTALLSGVLRHGSAAQAGDPATSGDEVLLLGDHGVRVYARRRGTGVTWRGRFGYWIGFTRDISRRPNSLHPVPSDVKTYQGAVPGTGNKRQGGM